MVTDDESFPISKRVTATDSASPNRQQGETTIAMRGKRLPRQGRWSKAILLPLFGRSQQDLPPLDTCARLCLHLAAKWMPYGVLRDRCPRVDPRD